MNLPATAEPVMLAPIKPDDPAALGYPPMLPVELAMRTDTVQNICRAYGIDKPTLARLLAQPVFVKAYQEAIEMLKIEGMSFKLKARMQAEAYLATAFTMAQNPATSDAVRQKIIADTVRWAGYDKKAEEAGQGNSFAIQINLG